MLYPNLPYAEALALYPHLTELSERRTLLSKRFFNKIIHDSRFTNFFTQRDNVYDLRHFCNFSVVQTTRTVREQTSLINYGLHFYQRDVIL